MTKTHKNNVVYIYKVYVLFTEDGKSYAQAKKHFMQAKIQRKSVFIKWYLPPPCEVGPGQLDQYRPGG
jgi:hypothetical protein